VTVTTGAAIGSATLDVVVGAIYCAKLLRKTTRPRIATWIIFELGVAMSLLTYMSSNDHSLLKAALNVTDAIVVTFIVAALLIRRRGERIVFTRSEKLSLVISGVALVMWGVTKAAWIGFVGFQIVMTVAYVPTIENMWRWYSGPVPEPADAWGINALAALMGVIVDVTGAHQDYLAALYPLRAFVFCVLVVVLAWRWNRLNRRALVWMGYGYKR
jgi:hypothetical protein